MSLLGRDTRGSESDAGLLASVYSISSDRQEVSARYDMIQGKESKARYIVILSLLFSQGRSGTAEARDLERTRHRTAFHAPASCSLF